MTCRTHSILGIREVKGAATEASASDNEIPAWAAFRAYTHTKKYINKATHILKVCSFQWIETI